MRLKSLSGLVKTVCEFLSTVQQARQPLLLSLLLLLVSSVPGHVGAQEIGITKPIQKLVGEDYLYAIDFLFFTKLAEGELPTFDVTITPTNTNATGAETAPTYTAPVA